MAMNQGRRWNPPLSLTRLNNRLIPVNWQTQGWLDVEIEPLYFSQGLLEHSAAAGFERNNKRQSRVGITWFLKQRVDADAMPCEYRRHLRDYSRPIFDYQPQVVGNG